MKKCIMLLLALFLVTPLASQAATRYETTVERGVNFRAAPSTDAYIFRMIPKGEKIHVIGKHNAYWLKIQVQDGTVGYISSDPKYTNYSGSGSGSSSGTGTIIRGVNFRSAPKVADNIIGFISKGTKVEVLEKTNNWWVKVRYNGRTGYVDADFISISGGSGSGGGGSAPVNNGGKADQIIDFAKSLMGKVTYKYGVRDTKNLVFDCSSFTQYVFDRYGVSLKWGTRYQKDAGRAVSKSNLQKGDLVFFGTSSKSTINHVGIYIGNGQFIHNKPSSNGVAIDNLNSGYWKDHYISARRVL